MIKKGVIYDLDNTIYPVPSIGGILFATLFQMIVESGAHKETMAAIEYDILRKPFQLVAAKHGFSKELTQKGIEYLSNLTYDGKIKPFPDYSETKRLPGERFLVTTGFIRLQMSKIRGMGIENDFKEIHVIDPMTSQKTKKDVFQDIMHRNGYDSSDLLVVGDDMGSEIKAAIELGIDAVLYDRDNLFPADVSTKKIADFKELADML
jgi:putative hydrolase of the HAD superfamily